MLKTWLELCRISNLPTAWTNVIAGWLLAGGSLRDQRLLWLLLGGSLMYSAGMILNDACDAKWDREHRKERPIPSGRVSESAAWWISMAGLIAGWWLMSSPGGANTGLGLLLLAAIVIYDIFHKQWAGSVFVMGSCRILLYLTAGSAATSKWLMRFSADQHPTLFSIKSASGEFEMPNPFFVDLTIQIPKHGWLLPFAIGIGCYIVGLTLIARNEARTTVTGLAAWSAKLLLIAPGILAAAWMLRHQDWRMLLFIAAFAMLISFAIRVMKKGGPGIGQAVGILLAGIAVVDALAVATVSFPLACAFVTAAPMLRLWQRWIAAT